MTIQTIGKYTVQYLIKSCKVGDIHEMSNVKEVNSNLRLVDAIPRTSGMLMRARVRFFEGIWVV